MTLIAFPSRLMALPSLTNYPKVHRVKKKGRAFAPDPFLSSESPSYCLRVYVSESCRNSARLARNEERDVCEVDGPYKDLRLLRARAIEVEVCNIERFRADVEFTPSLPGREVLRGGGSR